MEEKFRKAMVANAGLDNEKSQLTYQVRLHNLVIHMWKWPYELRSQFF